MDRRNQKKYIGNTLEKPNILLKRTFVRDTNFEKENLQQDVEYKEGLNERYQDTGAKHKEQHKSEKVAGEGR